MKILAMSLSAVVACFSLAYGLGVFTSEKQVAWTAAKAAVLAKISTPATAVFPNNPTEISDKKVFMDGKWVMYLDAYVDAQNQFGTMTRHTFTAFMSVNGDDAKVLGVVFDPERFSTTAADAFGDVSKRTTRNLDYDWHP